MCISSVGSLYLSTLTHISHFFLSFISSPFVWSPIPLFLISPNCSVILRISSLYGKIFEACFVSRLVKVRGEFASPVRAGFVYSNTALRKEEGCINTRWGKECVQACPKFLIASPTFHGGRGALPSAGGHPADLTFLAGVKQVEDDNLVSKGAIPEQLKCPRFCFRDIRIPLYRFSSQSLLDDNPFEGHVCITEDEQSALDSLLLAQWEDKMWKGVLRYDVTTSEIKVIFGRRKFIAQLNERLGMDYVPKPEPDKICGQGNISEFQWTKHQEEFLFYVASGEMAIPELIPSATMPDGAVLIIINEIPVEYGHVFLVPCGSDSLAQVLDTKSLEMVARFAVEINNCSFRLFYDCPTAGTSHRYFEACYFPSPLPVELTPVDTFFHEGQRGMRISAVTDFPIKTLLFESNKKFKRMVEVLVEICCQLHEKSIPYNLLISDCGKKIFLFLQMQNMANSGTLSAWECGGYFLFQSRSEFDQATEETMLNKLRDVSLDDEGFQVVKELCCSIADKFAA